MHRGQKENSSEQNRPKTKEISINEILNRGRVTPPALRRHLENIASEKVQKTENSRNLSNDLINGNSENIEWMILPKDKKRQRGLLHVNDDINITSLNEENCRKNENCLVSPIFLKKKTNSNDFADEVDDNQTEMLNSAVIIEKNPELDQMANLLTPNKCSDMFKNMAVSSLRKSLRTLKSSRDRTLVSNEKVTPTRIKSNSSVQKSARKKLDLTPCSNKKIIGRGFLTPTLSEKNTRFSVTNPSSDLDKARQNLQASTVPESLPCRNNEFNDIRNYILRKLRDESGGCMYVSGVPGTGKTATVHAVVKSLQRDSVENAIPAFDFVEVNGLRLTEPRQCYVRIWQILTGNKVVMEVALKNLENKFLGRSQQTTLILLDELDYLCNKRQDVIYNLLDWTSKPHSKLIIITIANTMDLPERTLKGKIASRMGLTRLVFQPYTYQQLQQIVMNRLGNCDNFHPDAVQLVSRKVAAISGDARRALDICRRALEDLDNNSGKTVTVFNIEKVINAIFTGVRVQAIKNSSAMCQLVLRSIRDEVLRTGIEETSFHSVFNQLQTICTLDGVFLPNLGEVAAVCNLLADYGLILAEKNRTDLKRKISLNVSPDDIHYALN